MAGHADTSMRLPGHRSERGAIVIQVALASFVLLAFTMFVVDYGILWVSRSAAQNAADGGALAGATALALDDFENREDDGPAKLAALNFALANDIFGEDPDVDVETDIYFYPDDPAKFPAECDDDSCIRVDVYRNQDRGNPLPMWFGLFVGLTEQGVRATATARAAPASWSNCLKPWLIPDKWIENVAPAAEFNFGENEGDPSDVYVNPGWSELDIGTTLTLKEGNPSTNDPIAPGDFFRIEPADTYRDAIEGCIIQQGIGDNVIIRPGNGVGPTRLGVEALLAANNGEPVTVVVGMFDPAAFAALDRQSGTFEIEIVNMMGFRIEGYGPGNQVRGTIVAAPGELGGPEDDTAGNLLKAVQLVR